MRKRSKYRPKPVYLNAFQRAIEGVRPIGEEHPGYLVELQIKTHEAMRALTHGGATKVDMDRIIATANIMEAFRLMGVCTPLSDEIAAGRRAVIDICVRAVKAQRFVPTGPEMLALNTLMELHDELLPHITTAQMEEGIELAKKIIRKGDATVLPTVEKLMQEGNT